MTPVYWMDETSGKMKFIVQKFLNDESLTEDEMNTFRWYIHQFADAMPSKPIDLHTIFKMNQSIIKIYLQFLLEEFGIDPL